MKLLEDSMVELFHIFEKHQIEISANLIFANDDYIVVTRYLYFDPSKFKKTQYPPSLYFSGNEKSLLITSEPITEKFHPFPMNTMMILHPKTMSFKHIVIPVFN